MCRVDPRIFLHDEREEQRCLVFADQEASSGWAAMTEPRFPCPIDRVTENGAETGCGRT